MTLSEEITRLNNAKQDIASALRAKGVTVDNGASIDQYGAYVRSIPQEGSSAVEEIYYADFTVDFQNYAITGASTNYQTIVENIEAGKYIVGRGTYAFISSSVNIGYFPLTAYVKEQNMLIFSGFAQAMSGSTIVLLSLTIEIPSSNIPTVRARLVTTTDLK